MLRTGSRAMRLAVATGLSGLVVVAAPARSTAVGAGHAADAGSIADALDRYDRGEWTGALAEVDPAVQVGPFTSALEQWSDAGDSAAHAHRQLVAAAFALDAAWRATRATAQRVALFQFSGDDPTGGSGNVEGRDWPKLPVFDPRAEFAIVAWACSTMPTTGALRPMERWWWLASVGMLEDDTAWRALVPEASPSHSTTTKTPYGREVVEGHLAHARARLPEEPRWRMADAVTRASLALRTEVRPSHWSRPDVLGAPPDAPAAFTHAERAFEPLLQDATLSGEAELQIGYLETRRQAWTSGVAHLDRAAALVTEPALTATVAYLQGWIDDRLGHTADAIEAYRRSLASAPDTRNSATLLATDLFLTGHRTEAYGILDRMFKTDPPALDLVTMLMRGDARLVAGDLRHMREALDR